MRVVTIELPAPVVTLDEACAHLRGVDTLERAYVSLLIEAAQGHIDGPQGWLGRAIGVQTLELRADCWPSSLPYRPVIDIVSIHVDDAVVEGVTVAPDGVLDVPNGMPRPAREMRVRYRAGYARLDGENLIAAPPAPIKAAILLMVADLYSNRETVSEGGKTAIPMSTTVEALLAPFRIWSF